MLQDISKARRYLEVLRKSLVLIRRGGVPSGAAALLLK